MTDGSSGACSGSSDPASAASLQAAADLYAQGRLAEAAGLYLAVVEREPERFEANQALARIAMEAGQAAAGLPYWVAAINADPGRGDSWIEYIDALILAGDVDSARQTLAIAEQHGLQGDALVSLKQRLDDVPAEVARHREIERMLALFGAARYHQVVASAFAFTGRYADDALGWKILGAALKSLGRDDEALPAFQQAVSLAPGDVEARYNLGLVLQALGRLDEAAQTYRQALALDPDYVDAALNLGVVLHVQGKDDEAETWLRRATELAPRHRAAQRNLAVVLHARRNFDQAELAYRHALALDANDAETHHLLATLLQEQGRLDEADQAYGDALARAPGNATLHGDRAGLLRFMGRLDDAQKSYREAIRRAPGEAKWHAHLGTVLNKNRDHIGAEAAFRQALALAPENLDTAAKLGSALLALGKLEQAEACYRDILATEPDNVGALSGLAQTLLNAGKTAEAERTFGATIEVAPDNPILFSNYLQSRLLQQSSALEGDQIFAAHRQFSERFETPLIPAWPHHTPGDPERLLKIGFISADFFDHPVAMFLEPMLKQLSGQPLLEMHAFHNNIVNDEVTQRLRGYFDHWQPIFGLPDAEVAADIRASNIDILIDLAGHTADNRLLVLAHKPAPLQASWMGYPGTTGLKAVDYFFADRFLLPPGRFDHHFVEQIVRLPANTPFLPRADAPPINPLPALANGFMTFGSFNRPNKLNRETISLWSALLTALPDARMVLGSMTERGHEQLLEWFALAGIQPDRLDFHPRTGMAEYLTLHHQVDLCLDTFPYNGGTTTQLALWMGVPTLTVEGDCMHARTGGAILARAGLQDFVADSADEFVARGCYWAEHATALAELRAGMREMLDRAPLRQPAVLAGAFYQALRTMWRRWCAGLPAESFEVPVDPRPNSADRIP